MKIPAISLITELCFYHFSFVDLSNLYFRSKVFVEFLRKWNASSFPNISPFLLKK